MTNTIRRPSHIFMVVLSLALALTACGGVKSVNKFKLIARPNILYVDGVGRMDVKATCSSGEQMLGGGYYIQYSSRDITQGTPFKGLIVEASYPSAANEWTVTVFNPDTDTNGPNQGISVYAEAYCLATPGFSVGMQTVQSQANSVPIGQLATTQVQCPAGSTVTGDGFKLDNSQLHAPTDVGLYNNGLWSSAPLLASGHAIGWRVEEFFILTPPPTTTLYALCATQNLTAADPKSVDIYTDTHNGTTYYFYAQAGQSQCAADEFSTGGGFQFGGQRGPNPPNYYIAHPLWQNTANKDFSEWHIEAWYGHNYGGTASLLAWALCVKVPTVYVTVKITSPADQSSFGPTSYGSGHTKPVTFTASATDSSGNPLTGAALQWTYDGDSLGTGETFSTMLKADTCVITPHKVTVTATDSAGHSGSDTITVYTGNIC